MPRPKGTSSKFSTVLDKQQRKLRDNFVFSTSAGPQVSHIINFQHWLIKIKRVQPDLVNQLNREVVNFPIAFININLLSDFAIFLVNQEERAFSYVRDTLFSVLNLSINKGLVVTKVRHDLKKLKCKKLKTLVRIIVHRYYSLSEIY